MYFFSDHHVNITDVHIFVQTLLHDLNINTYPANVSGVFSRYVWLFVLLLHVNLRRVVKYFFVSIFVEFVIILQDGQWIERRSVGENWGTWHGAQWCFAHVLNFIWQWTTHSVVWSCSSAVAVDSSHSRSLSFFCQSRSLYGLLMCCVLLTFFFYVFFSLFPLVFSIVSLFSSPPLCFFLFLCLSLSVPQETTTR